MQEAREEPCMTAQATSLPQALAEVEFVVHQQGETKGVFVPVAVWEAMLTALEDVEDLTIARDFLSRRAKARSPEEMGLDRWEDAASERDHDEAAQVRQDSLSSSPGATYSLRTPTPFRLLRSNW
jgi:hypothetical protein